VRLIGHWFWGVTQKNPMINIESLALLSHLVIIKLHFIVGYQDFRKLKLAYDILS
jgi:hypothetical protein